MTPGEICVRCAASMEWRHGTWQCPRCRFKIGCCEGETGECAAEAPSGYESVVSPGAGVASGAPRSSSPG